MGGLGEVVEMGRGKATTSILVLLAAATMAVARPFEKLPAGHSAYQDLKVLERAGLLGGAPSYTPGTELTRLTLAGLWQAAYDLVSAPSARAARRLPRPDRDIVRVCDALGRLLEVLAPEVTKRGVRPVEAREALREAQWWVPGLSSLQLAAARSVGEDLAVRSALSPASTSLLTTPALGPASAGLSLRPLQAVEYDRLGPSRLVSGHVLAADLRLRYGDYNVLFEYGRALINSRPSLLGDDDGAAELKAHFLASLRDRLTLDLGYGRYSGHYSSLSPLVDAGPGPVHGLQLNLGGNLRGVSLHGGGGFYRPQGATTGFLYQYGTGVSYQPLAAMKLSVGYETSARRSVANLDDAWRDFINAEVDYAIGQRMRCTIDYRFNNLTTGLSTQDNSEHQLGVKVQMGF